MKNEESEASIFDSILLPGIEERTVSATDIAADGGAPEEFTLELVAGFGLTPPPPDQPAFTPEEARAFSELHRLRDVWTPELAIQLSRVYGRHLARIAQASIQLFRLYVERQLWAQEGGRLEAVEATQAALADLLPLANPFLTGVYRRWVEHELAQTAVRDAETESGSPLPGAVEVALLFCDLKDFTAFADLEGDAAAITQINLFMEVVARDRGPNFRFMKSLGDGVMLSYDEATEAVEAGARIVSAMRAGGVIGVHASAHKGIAVAYEGDYFGGAVNLAAHLLAVAARDELVVTRAIVEACDGRFHWEEGGTAVIRGVGEPVEVFRLRM